MGSDGFGMLELRSSRGVSRRRRGRHLGAPPRTLVRIQNTYDAKLRSWCPSLLSRATLYDTPETQAAVTEVIQWYKKYRDILNSDMIHLRRPDARDWDGFIHVNPHKKEKGLAMFFNPTHQEITRTIHIPLYYTGLTQTARIREKE